jgi:5'-3' exonuclease
MGIPSYFSYIVKNYHSLLNKIQTSHKSSTGNFHNFYLDCNSIIYDAVHNTDFTNLQDTDINTIIHSVIGKMDEYIRLIKPSTNLFIAFDGVAPVAKLDQQRSRRYKSVYQNQITKSIYKNTQTDPWNTAAITPGTNFMNKLNEKIRKHFNDPKAYHLENIYLSLSNKYGEGEHKIFEFIRAFPEYHANSSTVVYGLDADLIMLCINHLPISKEIYLFRETPHFIQNISSELEPNENYVLNIPQLAQIITLDMNHGKELNYEQEKNRIYDYIFMCFFLGNDFMPHFPSINIRTGGVYKMMNAYKATIGGTNENLYDGKKIVWKNVRKLVAFLAELEEQHFKEEMKLRDKREKVIQPNESPEQVLQKFNSLPTHERSVEKFINPYKSGWEYRYYKSLFFMEIDEVRKKQICINYLEGLEWTMKYYTTGCADWRWCYQHHYPPLLTDLMHYIPYYDTELIENKPPKPVNELVQLCYVLPKQSLTLLPETLYHKLMKEKTDWYQTNCEFLWPYCKYFWESHVLLPHIEINELEEYVANVNKL